MKKFRTTMITLFLIFAVSSSALANGLSLNSIGAKALSMGGAFVGLANDGSAIYWNPAGLAGQQSSLEIYFTGIMPSGTYKYDAAAIDASMKSNLYTAPGFFGNYSFGKWAVGLGIYVPAGLGAEWDGAELANLSGGTTTEWMSQIGVITFSPAVAYQVTDKFSLGLAVNINYGMFDLKRPAPVPGVGVFQYEESSSGIGYSFTIGAKYDFSEMISAGLSFRSKSSVEMSGDAKNPAFGGYGAPESDFDRSVSWPIWIGGGLAIHPSEKLTITIDGQYSQWSELNELDTKYQNAIWKGALEPTGDNKFILNWEDAIQIRLGGEYMVSKSVAVRLGYYYDPAPGPDETYNILFPSMTNHVATGGLGYYAEKFKIEGAFEYLIGTERTIALSEHSMPGVHQMSIFAFSVNFGYNL